MGGGVVMKPFSLEEYIKNPSRKIVTRDGKNVRIICINAKGNFPIIALVETHNGTETVLRLSEDGHFYNYAEDSNDLFFATEKQEGWINVYLDAENDSYVGTCIYKSKEDAENNGKIWKGYVTTLKIEWGN